ncbi:MAG: YecA family protein [Methylibium sp.]|nr:YecA family protein [Methylibium sp.]
MEYPSYNPSSDNLPLTDEELDGLDRQLNALPGDAAMNIEALDGYLTGLLLSPRPLADLPGRDWLPPVWGGDGDDGAPFASGKQRKKLVLLVLRHLHSIACLLRDRPDGWQPIFSIAEQSDGEELTDAEDWCIGFMQAADLDSEGWAPRFEDPVLAEVLKPIVSLGGDETLLDDEAREQLADIVARDGLSRSVPDAVLALWSYRPH